MSPYLIRHWRGQLPLGLAWWVNGIVLTALSLALEFNAARLGLGNLLTTRNGFTAWLVAGVLLLLLVPAWQIIGIFRAADRHAAEVGTLLAARLAQALTTVLAILLAMRFFAFAGEAVAGARLAYPFAGADYTLSVTHGGRLLEVSGGLGLGVAEAARRALTQNPGVRRVRLNSGGGLLTEGQALRELIIAHRLDTDSTTGCASACVSAYIGGRQRLLRTTARLGLHLPRNPGFGLRGRLNGTYAAEIAYFASRGVPAWFLKRWVDTGRTFWYPTPRQLQSAGLVHAFYGRPAPGTANQFF